MKEDKGCNIYKDMCKIECTKLPPPLYVPAEQVVQDRALAPLYVPAEQVVQDRALVPLYVPAAQDVQVEEPIVL